VTKVLPRAALILLVLAAMAARAEDAAPVSATNLYRQLSSVRLDPDRVFRVRDLSIEIHEIHLTFTDGVIAFTNSVNGEVTGAYFQGEGEALVRPPDLVERESLALFTGNAILEEKFTAAFFRFRGGEMGAAADRLRVPVAATEVVAKGDGVMQSLASMDALALLDDALNRPGASQDTGYFHARVQGVHLGNFDINFDRDVPEQITIGRVNEQSGRPLYDIWTRFASRGIARSEADTVLLPEYGISAKVQPPTDLSADVSLVIKPQVEGVRCVVFELSRNLRIKSVDVVEPAKPGSGSPRLPLEFIQNESLEGTELARRGNDVAAIIFPGALKRGETTNVQLSYAGPVMSDAGNGLVYVGARGTWYPNRGPAMADFNLMLQYPADWSLVASGRLDHLRPGDQWQTSVWSTDQPVPVAGFNLGKYEKTLTKAGNTDVAVYAAKGMESLEAPTAP